MRSREGAAYEELISKFNRTQEDVAREVGKSRSHVANTIRLLKLPDQVKAWIREGKLTAGHARTLLSEADPVTRARELIEGAMTVRQGRTAFGFQEENPVENPPKTPILPTWKPVFPTA
jgi:ParB family chromosome partitioning protein